MVKVEYSQIVRKKLKRLRNDLTQNYGEHTSKKVMVTHASDYVIAIDGKQEGGDGAAESAQPDGKDGTAGNGTAMEKPSQEGQQWRLWWLIVAGVLVLAMGAGVFFIRKKKSDEN